MRACVCVYCLYYRMYLLYANSYFQMGPCGIMLGMVRRLYRHTKPFVLIPYAHRHAIMIPIRTLSLSLAILGPSSAANSSANAAVTKYWALRPRVRAFVCVCVCRW